MSVNRKGSINSKSNKFIEKTFNNYNLQSENNEPISVKIGNSVIPESETDSKEKKETETKQQQDGIIIEKNELFTFMTSDNCNPSQRVIYISYSLNLTFLHFLTITIILLFLTKKWMKTRNLW